MEYSRPFLGKTVKVSIDRKLGSKHPKHDFTYPINYGFIPDTTAPDGAELDAYVFGVDVPIIEFEGKCIAIIHRLDDDDDKLIVCNENETFSDDQIKKITHFQEQYFKSEIIRL
ncbi:MAG: inorganic diphosphatase [bacterium]